MINNLVSKSMGFLKNHSPEILIATGVVGMTTSTILAVRATPKALQLMEDKKAELGVTYLTRKEIAEATWKQYIPAVGIGVVSAACIVLGTTKNLQRNAALATVYAVSESTLREYQKKTKEVVGEEKEKEIRSEVAKASVKDKQVIVESRDSEYVHHTGNGDTLIYDSFSGRYFRSSMNDVERAANQINKRLYNDYIMTVNDFYDELNIPTIGAGSLIGWKSDNEMMDIGFDSDVDRLGNPYLVLTYHNRPSVIYREHGSW